MKVLAARAVRDGDDLRFLLGHLDITSSAEVWAIVQRYFPDTEIPQRSKQLVKDLTSALDVMSKWPSRNRRSSPSRTARAAKTFIASRCRGDVAATCRYGWSKTRLPCPGVLET